MLRDSCIYGWIFLSAQQQSLIYSNQVQKNNSTMNMNSKWIMTRVEWSGCHNSALFIFYDPLFADLSNSTGGWTDALGVKKKEKTNERKKE